MFMHDEVKIIALTGEIVVEGVKCYNDLCCLFIQMNGIEGNQVNTSLQFVHELLGHVNKQRLKQIIKNKVVAGLPKVIDNSETCKGCVKEKMHHKPAKHTNIQHHYESGECMYIVYGSMWTHGPITWGVKIFLFN